MVVLATKVYVTGSARERAMDSLGSLVDNAIGDLDVAVDVGLRHDGFPSVTVTGADATAARNVLREEWGQLLPHKVGESMGSDEALPDTDGGAEGQDTPSSSGDDQSVYVGTLESWNQDGFVLDSGQPVEIPTENIGLGGGTPSQIRTRFGLVQHLPIRFVPGADPALAEAERDRLFDWRRAENGRVNVNSATRAEVRATVNRAGHADDIVTIERLGLLEQSIVCTEDTDPPGLLASIGDYLPAELLAVVP